TRWGRAEVAARQHVATHRNTARIGIDADQMVEIAEQDAGEAAPAAAKIEDPKIPPQWPIKTCHLRPEVGDKCACFSQGHGPRTADPGKLKFLRWHWRRGTPRDYQLTGEKPGPIRVAERRRPFPSDHIPLDFNRYARNFLPGSLFLNDLSNG